MSKLPPNHNNLADSRREAQFLRAINTAVAAVAKSTHSETAVFNTFALELRKLGLNGAISMLDAAGENLVVKSLVMPETMDKAVKAAEKIMGIESVGYTYSVKTAHIDRMILQANEPVFLEDNSEKLQQVFPQLGFIGRQALRPFSGIPAIIAPIALEGRVEGTLYLAGAHLVEADVSAISIFANQIANALLEARLLQTIQQTEAQYRLLFETANDAILVFDVVTERIISANPMALTMTGYDLETLYTLPLAALFPNGQLPLQPSLFDRASKNQAFMVEAALQQKGGNMLVVQISANPFQLQGRLLLQGFLRDITEQKRIETLQTAVYQIATIASSDISLDNLYHSIHQVVGSLMEAKNFYIALYDRKDNMLMLPYFVDERDTFDGKSYPAGNGLTEFVIRSGLPKLVAGSDHEHLISTGLVERVGPGSKIWLGVPLKNGTETFGAIVVQSYEDQSLYTEQEMQFLVFVSGQIAVAIERKRAEEERKQLTVRLERQVSMLDAVLSATPDNLYIYDLNGRFMYVSHSGARMLGFSRAELIGKTWAELGFNSGAIARFEQEREQVRITGKPFTNEATATENGIIRYIEYSINPVFDKQGEMTMFVATTRDITERKRAEEALHHTQKIESLGVLAGGVAHDFNNLLVAILGQTSLALTLLQPTEPAFSHINKAVKAAERASELTNQLLAYSGRGQFAIESLNLNKIILENRHLLDVAIPVKVNLQLNLAENLPLIEADPGQIQQVVMNLIINAAEALVDKPGRILIETTVKNITADTEQFWRQTNQALAPGSYVSLRVEDNGDGMDTETVDRIFDPFFTTKFTGRGLGLAAVLGIVRGHRGGLKVSSQPGKGTIFELIFPVSIASVPLTVPVETDLRMSSGVVLVIDDEKPVLEAVQDILELHGLQVLCAENGRLGLALYEKHQKDIDLILLDWSMPEMNGSETFAALRKYDPDVRVILSSGYSEIEAADISGAEQLVGYLQKPYSLITLADAVRKHIPVRE
ncbi:MAG: PAS domain S-box protein [Anaerolineae bacterium]|nr:PAS domain S-box protein [Anaerolineae bacterium]